MKFMARRRLVYPGSGQPKEIRRAILSARAPRGRKRNNDIDEKNKRIYIKQKHANGYRSPRYISIANAYNIIFVMASCVGHSPFLLKQRRKSYLNNRLSSLPE